MTDVMDEYQSSLEDLTFNSKPHINMLTILAEENQSHAESVVDLIEAQIAKASVKLPLLYLLDSIIKNVGENYKPLFAKNLASTFKVAFQSADDKSKMSMYKLRSTWDSYFPLKKLYALDTSIKELDPNWPVKTLPTHLQDNTATTIHVNPKFIKQASSKASQSSAPTIKTATSIVKTTGQHSDVEVDKIRQQLVRQQKELLDLQQKKLILELEQTKQQLAAKQKEMKHTATKKQEKTSNDSKKSVPITSAAAGLRVTLSNVKAKTPSATTTQVSTTPKDPRIKGSAAISKSNVGNTVKKDASKTVTVGSNAKKNASKATVKKDKASPNKSKITLKAASTSPKSTPEKKVISKKKALSSGQNISTTEGERKKKRTAHSKSPPSPSPPPLKIPRTIPASSDQRKRPSKPNSQKSQQKAQRVQKIKEPKKERLNRVVERSESPRFSPEPDSNDERLPIPISPPVAYPRREDALRRRPSFDPDLHIPKELTLSHQNEILKQADHQLRSGQLTHRQHQELLKQLHQLFEVQRMKKLQDTEPHPHERGIPADPRARRRERPRYSHNQDPRRRDDLPLERYPRDRRMSPEPLRRFPPKHSEAASDQYGARDRRPLGPGHNRERRPPKYPPLDPRQMGPNAIRKPTPRYPGPEPENRSREDPGPMQDPRAAKKRPLLPLPPQKHVKQKRPLLDTPNMSGSRPKRPAPLLPLPHHDVMENRPSGHDMKASDDKRTLENEKPMSPPPKPPLSPPPFFLQHAPQSVGMSVDAPQPFSSGEPDKKSNLRQYAIGKPSPTKVKSNQKPVLASPSEPLLSSSDEEHKQIEEKKGPEEPEDYIIANMPKVVEVEEESSGQLEEPEDYIIAGMKTKVEAKSSCEEPEDFIIAQMPPGAEAYHNHSLGLRRRNSDSEKAYVDHIKKIKQSMYSKELHDKRRESDSVFATEESSSEKHSGESSSEKEGIKSPSLPLKKRRYINIAEAKSEQKIEEKETFQEKPSEKAKIPETTEEKLPSSVPTKSTDEKVKVISKEESTESTSKEAISDKKDVNQKEIAPKSSKVAETDIPVNKEQSKTKKKKPESKPEKSSVMSAKEKDFKLRKALEKRLGKAAVDKKFSPEKGNVETNKKAAKPKGTTEPSKPMPKPKDISQVKKTLSKDDFDIAKKVTKTKDDTNIPPKFSKAKDDSEIARKFPKSKSDLDLRKKFPKSSGDSTVYVIEDEPLEKNIRDPRAPPRRLMKRPFEKREERRRGPPNFQDEEEARLQQLMKEEQEKLEWEETLTRELEREQWKEDRMRRGMIRRGRGRGRYMPPERWESPPRDLREPGNFDVARGKIFHRDPGSRMHPRMPGGPPRGPRPLFPPMDEIRMRHPVMDDPRRPPSPGRIRPPGPGWDRRPLTPPGLRIPPPSHPPFHDGPDERRLEWDRHAGRMPPRGPLFHPEERRSPVELHRMPVEAPPTMKQVNVDKLLTDLLSMGIIPGPKKPEVKSESPAPPTPPQPDESKPTPPTTEIKQEPTEDKPEEKARSPSPFIEKEDLMVLDPDAELPDVTLTSDLKIRHDEFIKRIYTGIQCSACGLRFTTRQTDIYADHLDWHYRLNRKDKEGAVSTHRELYPSAGEWICYEEIGNPEERAKSSFFEDTDQPAGLVNTELDNCAVPLTGSPGEDACKVCKEAFQTIFNEDDDEWQFVDCIKVGGFNYHPNCYSDRDNMPPPVTPLISPRDGIPGLDTVKEEPMDTETTSLNTLSIKTEPPDDTTASATDVITTAVKTEPEDSTEQSVIVKSEPMDQSVIVKSEPEDSNEQSVAIKSEPVGDSNQVFTVKSEAPDTEQVVENQLKELQESDEPKEPAVSEFLPAAAEEQMPENPPQTEETAAVTGSLPSESKEIRSEETQKTITSEFSSTEETRIPDAIMFETFVDAKDTLPSESKEIRSEEIQKTITSESSSTEETRTAEAIMFETSVDSKDT